MGRVDVCVCVCLIFKCQMLYLDLPFLPSAKDSAIESVKAERTLSATTFVTPAFFTTRSNNSVFLSACCFMLYLCVYVYVCV
jgi:hypothetical protein